MTALDRSARTAQGVPAQRQAPGTSQTELVLLVLLATIALVLDVFGARMWVHAPQWRPPAPPSLDALARGAPFARFPVLASSYFTFSVRWMTVPFILVVSFLLHRHLAGWRVRGALTAVFALGLTDLLLLQCVPKSLRFVAHPTRIWAVQSNLVVQGSVEAITDAEGYRCTPAHRPSPVAVVGDSTTFGVSVERNDQTYCWLLARRLATQGGPGVINRGVPGYTSWQGRNLLGETLQREAPRLVVAAYMANDWTAAAQPDEALALEGFAGRLRATLRQRPLYLALERLLLDENLEEGGGAIRTSTCRVPVISFEANLTAMREMCAARGIPLVFVSLPVAPSLDAVSAPYRAAVARVATMTGAPHVDLFTDWKKRGWNRRLFNPIDPLHPTADGHAEIARSLCDVVSQELRR